MNFSLKLLTTMIFVLLINACAILFMLNASRPYQSDGNLTFKDDHEEVGDIIWWQKETTNFPVERRNKKDFDDYLSKLYFNYDPFLPLVDCAKVISGDEEEVARTKLLQRAFTSNTFKVYSDQRKKFSEFENEVVKMAQNCSDFFISRKYITRPLSNEEAAYPLAYIFIFHEKFSSFEKLLRSIYQPQNIYCVHVDAKADPLLIEKIRNLTKCFSNVFVASNLTKVYYTHWTLVEANLNCLKDLVKKKVEVPWKYVINLCGLDFPLKTNYEIVRDIKSMHGYNILESSLTPESKKYRYEYSYNLTVNDKNKPLKRASKKNSSSPLDIPMFAGSAFFVLKREAIEFMLTDSKVQAFFKWNEDTFAPEEHVWATLQRWYPHLPGSAPSHSKYDTNELEPYTRLVKWIDHDSSVYPKCAGTYRRGVCVYGAGDLSWLVQQHHFFANKFDAETDPFAIECLDTWLRNRTITQAKKYNALGYV